MPTPYEPFDTAGRECSSTYEGRHVTLRADMFESPTGTVTYGDPVVFGAIPNGYGVGVAFDTEVAASDWIAIDTEGIWALTVLAVDDEGASRVEIGDIIYINRTTCVLSKISSDTTNIVFGYALDTVAVEPGTGVICVKVHWDPHRTDEYRDYIAGGAAEDAMLIEVDDGTTLASGYTQCLQTTINATGAKTGTAEVHNIAADMAISGDTPYAMCYTAYISTSGDPTIGFMTGLSIVMDDMGDSVSSFACLDLETQGTDAANVPTTRHTFVRMAAHHAQSMPESLIHVEGNGADYAFDFMNSSAPFENVAVGAAADQRIAVRVGANVRYIELFVA